MSDVMYVKECKLKTNRTQKAHKEQLKMKFRIKNGKNENENKQLTKKNLLIWI